MTTVEYIAGIDEAGRGPLAGPVVASAVILGTSVDRSLLRDSKQMTAKMRSKVYTLIMNHAVSVGVGWCWSNEIDRINIHNASLLAMVRAYRFLTIRPDRVFIDGKFVPAGIPFAEAVVKGDTKIHEIMAASIVAKHVRDQWMIRYSWIEKSYGFDKHKGYPTLFHREICRCIGLSAIHRRSFTFYPSRRNTPL